MNDDKFLVLTTSFANRTHYLDMFLLRSNSLFDLHFTREVQRRQCHWNTIVGDALCEGVMTDNVVEKLFERVERFQAQKLQSQLYNIRVLSNKPGAYFPRISRPLIGEQLNANFQTSTLIDSRLAFSDYLPAEQELVVGAITQLSSTIDQLESLCRAIAPTKTHFGVYGHDIRDLLILTATEIEAQLRGIYEANFGTKPFNMEDYFLLNERMKLYQYEISFSLYPWMGKFKPFEIWSSVRFSPLPWYSAYNKVKHDRERKFEFASLENALNAVAALAILLIAEYGEDNLYWPMLIGDFFELHRQPFWEMEECYLPPLQGEQWKPFPR